MVKVSENSEEWKKTVREKFRIDEKSFTKEQIERLRDTVADM